MIAWLRRRWHARLRRIDVKFLWPACKEVTVDIHEARVTFLGHAFYDPAWLELGTKAMVETIEALK